MPKYHKRHVIADSNKAFVEAIGKNVAHTCLAKGGPNSKDVDLSVAVIKNELPVDELEVMHRHQLAILYNMNVDRARRRNACSSYEEMELNEKSLVRGVRTYFEGMKTLHQVRGPHTQPSFIVQTGPFQIPENQSPLALEARASAAAILPPPCVDEKALSQTSAKAKKITRGGSVEGEAKPLHRVRLPEAMRRADRSRCG